MKRIFSTFCLLLIALATIQAQYKMEVKTTDGHSFSFLTDEIESIIWNTCDSTTHDFVDLGLSVKWATCNVGATKPEEYGDYFAWGETEPHYEAGYAQELGCHWKPGKVGYSWDTYNYCKGTGASVTKYCDISYYSYNGTIDYKTVLDPEDDAAFMNWGGNWRMPTIAEFEELLDTCNCTWTWTTYGGIRGYSVVSKIPNYVGNWIFLPAAGERDKEHISNFKQEGDYWSSSLNESYPYSAHNLEFYTTTTLRLTNHHRSIGGSVRPVCSKEASTDTPTDTPTDAVLVTVYDLIDTEWEYYSYDFKTSTEPQPDVITSIIYAFKNSTEVRQVIKEAISGPGIVDTVIIKSDKILKYNLNDPYLTIGDQPLSFKFDSKHKFHSLDDDKVYEMIDY